MLETLKKKKKQELVQKASVILMYSTRLDLDGMDQTGIVSNSKLHT